MSQLISLAERLFLSTERDSDSDSELSLDEHSSSYASSHSSDSEEDVIDVEKKWNTGTLKNNERIPVHSTPKGEEYKPLSFPFEKKGDLRPRNPDSM